MAASLQGVLTSYVYHICGPSKTLCGHGPLNLTDLEGCAAARNVTITRLSATVG